MTKANERPMVTVKFKKDYVASRGPGIIGAKGEVKTYRMSDALKALLEDGTLSPAKETDAESRETAAGKEGEAAGKKGGK